MILYTFATVPPLSLHLGIKYRENSCPAEGNITIPTMLPGLNYTQLYAYLNSITSKATIFISKLIATN